MDMLQHAQVRPLWGGLKRRSVRRLEDRAVITRLSVAVEIAEGAGHVRIGALDTRVGGGSRFLELLMARLAAHGDRGGWRGLKGGKRRSRRGGGEAPRPHKTPREQGKRPCAKTV